MSRKPIIRRDEASSAIADLYESAGQKPDIALPLIAARGGSPAGFHA